MMRAFIYILPIWLSYFQPNFQLQCEHLIDPLGIDNTHPRLSWRSNLQQQSYTISVSTDSLHGASGLCWLKTGNKENMVTYSGKPLQPFTKYYWKVVIDGHQTSPTATFETGPLSISDWRGDWISDIKDAGLKRAAIFW